MVKNLPANAGDASLIPSQEYSLEKEMAMHSSILAWEIPWSLESYSPRGRKNQAPLSDSKQQQQ